MSGDIEVIELDFVARLQPHDQEYIKLMRVDSKAEDIKERLRGLPRRKSDGAAFGFIFYTWANNHKEGHAANFYVDKENNIFFIDAQGQDETTWIVAEPNLTHYRSEIFYLQSIPKEEFRLKKESRNERARLKHFRSIATRCDKLKRNFTFMLALACGYLWLPM